MESNRKVYIHKETFEPLNIKEFEDQLQPILDYLKINYGEQKVEGSYLLRLNLQERDDQFRQMMKTYEEFRLREYEWHGRDLDRTISEIIQDIQISKLIDSLDYIMTAL